jgi:L-amino acid N-acyltransferase YncA
MVVRDLRWEDFAPLTESHWALYDEVNEDPDLGISLLPVRPTLGEEAEWFARMFRRVQEGGSVAVVAEERGRAVGLCNVDPKGPQREGKHVGVLGISMARDWRGRGIGRALMAGALDQCRGKFEIVELVLYATNARARSLYESLGFRVWGTQPRAVRRGDRYIDAVYMQLQLRIPETTVPQDSASADPPKR